MFLTYFTFQLQCDENSVVSRQSAAIRKKNAADDIHAVIR